MTADDLDRRVADAVLSRGLIDGCRLGQVQGFVANRGGTLTGALRALHLVSSADLLAIMQEVTGIEALDPALVSIEPEFRACVDALWPRVLAVATRTIPIRFVGAALQVAMVEPWNLGTRTALEAFTGCPIVPALMLPVGEGTPAGEVANVIADRWRERVERTLASSLMIAAERVSRREAGGAAPEDLARSPEIILGLHAILWHAAAEGASDVHFDPEPTRLRIRFRIDGRLRDAAHTLPALLPALMARLRLLGRGDEDRSGQLEMAFTCAVSPFRRIEGRLSVVRAISGERCTLRLVDREAEPALLANIGMDEFTRSEVERAAAAPNGLVIVCGPTGSGKTQTVYSLLATRIADDVAVVTVEDPVERELAGVVQVPCHGNGGHGFADVFRALLRQDPDIIMVGEIRDAETATLAVRAASTGHLVLTSVHANSAAATIDRLVGLGTDPRLLASVLRAVIAQRLVRRLCRVCRTPVEISPHEWQQAGGEPEAPVLAFAPLGCSTCTNTGYAGRVAIFEVLRLSPVVREQVGSGATTATIERAAQNEGLTTLREAGLRLVRAGDTSLTEVLSLTSTDRADQLPARNPLTQERRSS